MSSIGSTSSIHTTSTPIRRLSSSGLSTTMTSLTTSSAPTTINRNTPPPINRASQHVERMLADIITTRSTKQPCDITAKTVLFLKTRQSAMHPSEYEMTPSVQFNKITVFDELRARAYACKLARELIEAVAQERRHGYYYDEVFLQLRSEITYTSNNFINAYYNSHCTMSVDPMHLAIQCVHLACKTQSTFKRLEKLVLVARLCFKKTITFDKNRFSEIEMDILQSSGFQLQDMEDYPHKYIYKFKPEMAKNYDVFKASDKKMMTLCHCAILLATKLVEACPIMLNRNSATLAAACLYISNGFKDILNIKEWWRNIDGCTSLTEKLLQEESDLVFDAVKHSQNHWTDIVQPLAPLKPITHESHSLMTTSTIGQSPPQSMMSPMSSLASESSGFGSDNSLTLNQFMKHKTSFTHSNSCSASTCSSESNSVKSELKQNNNHHPESNQHQKQHNNSFSKPEQIPFRKSISLLNSHHQSSPLARKPNGHNLSLHYPSGGSTSSFTPHPHRKLPPISNHVTTTTATVISSALLPPAPPLAASAGTPSTTASSTSSSDEFHLDLASPIQTPSTSLAHKLEKKYKNRLTALLCCEEITKYYASSKARYATLTRPEKEIVKDYKNKVRKMRQVRRLESMTTSVAKKRRRHSELPGMGLAPEKKLRTDQ